MKFRVGLESGDENRTVAWVHGHPGCFAYGKDEDEALEATPEAISAYKEWINLHMPGKSWIPDDGVEIEVTESYQVKFVNEQYEPDPDGYGINAWFMDDWKPLTRTEIERGLMLLSWSRGDLLETIRHLDEETLQRTYPGERWSIAGILRHTGYAEWWYLDKLGLAIPEAELPQDNGEMLTKIRCRLEEVLPGLEGSEKVVGVYAEFWSPRKMLRRALWHERDHTFHIQKLLPK